MFKQARQRYLDVLASIYVYNEHRGYSSLDRVLLAARRRCADEPAFIAEIEKHRADERKHYLMFKHYFEARGEMPLAVDRTCGHIDRLIKRTFGCHIDDLDTDQIVADERLFSKLCRVIMVTEQRGMRVVDKLLQSSLVRSDRSLMKIFHVVERDEPSHWMPYDNWLQRHGGGKPTLRERMSDNWVHLSLVIAKLPSLYFNVGLKRMSTWYDDGERAYAGAASDINSLPA